MNVSRIGADSVRVRPPAKLNLFLEVLYKRDDGYHEIETVMHAIDLCDEIVIERTRGTAIEIATTGYPAPADGTNLAVRAAEAYFSAVTRRFGLKLDLKKIIPAGAGLGGGSSDAAGVLTALNTLEDHPLKHADLELVAGSLGSDIPFFLTGGTAIARGRGEKIEPLDDSHVPAQTFVVLFPRVTSPTPLIYKSLSCDLTTPKRDLHRFLEDLGRSDRGRPPAFFNALAAPFRQVFPMLARKQDEISAATGRPFHVSGSGSAMFAVVENERAGEEVIEVLQAMAAGDTFLTRSLRRRLGTA